MSFRNTNPRRRRAGGLTHRSSLRLSSIVNPDLLNDVTFHTVDKFSRQAPSRRHTIASQRPAEAKICLPKAHATSEKVGISDAEKASLLDEWNENEADLEIKKIKLLESVSEVREVTEDEIDAIPGHLDEKLSWRAPFRVLVMGVFIGYVLSSAALQKLNSLRPGCGQFVVLLQYVATVGEKVPNARQYFFSPSLPLYWHASFVLLMFLSVQMSNKSLGVGLPFGLFLVIKNTNLAWSLLLGLATGQSFTTGQIASIGIVTAGISICVLAQNQSDGDVGDSVEVKVLTESDSILEDESTGSTFLIAASLCAASTFCMAALGSMQEIIFARYKDGDGQEAGESLFFTHLLGLPLFAVGGLDDMRSDISHLLKTPAITFSMLALNIVATLVVKQCFVELLEEGESLTATLAITVARMTGVVVSEVMAAMGFSEDSSSTSLHFWIGATLVALGSLSYAMGGKVPCRSRRVISRK